MTVGIQRTINGSQDLDDLFEQRIGTDPTTGATGIQATGTTVDLNVRYVPLSEGTAIASNTGVQTLAGTDLRNVFAKLGSVGRIPTPAWDSSYTLVSTTQEGNLARSQIRFFFTSSGQMRVDTLQNDDTAYTLGTPFDLIPDGDASNLYEARVLFISGDNQITTDDFNGSYRSLGLNSEIVFETTQLAVGTNETDTTVNITVREIANTSNNVSKNTTVTLRATVQQIN